MENLINTQTDTYLVEFANRAFGGTICNYSIIQEALKPINEGSILSNIYRYNESKRKFERVPKNKYNALFGWNTEAMEFLTKYI